MIKNKPGLLGDLRIREKANGNYLIKQGEEPKKIIIQNGRVMNRLTPRERKFVKDIILDL